MQYVTQGQQLYQELLAEIQATQRRWRAISIIIGIVLALICAYGLLMHSMALAMFGAGFGIVLLWMMHNGMLNGDPVAVCLRFMFQHQFGRLELAALDVQSSLYQSDSDYAIQRALELYRMVNRRRLQS